MFCHKCGSKIADDASSCHGCGAKVVREDIVQEPPNVFPINEKKASITETVLQRSAVPVQTIDRTHVPTDNSNNFKEFVDNHVRITTTFQSADDLLKNSKPLTFIWICIGIPAILGLVMGGPLGLLVFGGLFGYVATFIASAIIRGQYRGKFTGEFIGDINIPELFIFLNEQLKYIHPYFHEWGYLTKKGLLPILENAIANAMEEVRIGSEFGANKKSLVLFYMKPKTVDGKPGKKLYYIDAIKNGFLLDGRAAGFLGHSSLIRTAPILQAAMEYYLKNDKAEGENNNVLS